MRNTNSTQKRYELVLHTEIVVESAELNDTLTLCEEHEQDAEFGQVWYNLAQPILNDSDMLNLIRESMSYGLTFSVYADKHRQAVVFSRRGIN